MAKSEKAAAAIAALYAKKPAATLEQFLGAATAADPAVEGMPKRSFNATYLLPMKRAAAPKKARKTAAKAAPKKARKAKATAAPAKRTRKIAKPSFNGGSVVSARRLVLRRDQELLAALRTGGDPKVAYALAASVDDFVNELVTAVRG